MTSGIAHTEMQGGEDEVTATVAHEGSVRIYILPYFEWWCGYGFERLEGVVLAPGAVQYARGGSIEAAGLYGGSVGVAEVVPGGHGPHEAQAILDDRSHPVDESGAMFASANASMARLENIEWLGRPLWHVSGFPMPAQGWWSAAEGSTDAQRSAPVQAP